MPRISGGRTSALLEEIAGDVERAKQKLGPEVVRLRYDIGEDTSGEPAIHFRIVLADYAICEDTLAKVTNQITTTLLDELEPYDRGLRLYTSFRGQSEQAGLNDPAWD